MCVCVCVCVYIYIYIYIRGVCLNLVSELLIMSFYRPSLWLRRFLWGDHRLEIFALSSLCVWSQMSSGNLQIRVSPRGFFYANPFLNCQNL